MFQFSYYPVFAAFYSSFGSPPNSFTNNIAYNGSPESGGANPLPSYSLVVGQTVSQIEVLVWTEFGLVRTLIDNIAIVVGTTPITSGTNGYVLYNNSGIIGNATIQTVLGYVPENQANKALSFGTLNSTLYPTTQAVATYVAAQIAAIPGGVSLPTLNTTLHNFVTDFTTGLGYTSASGLVVTIGSGSASIGGQYVSFAGGTITTIATKDNYIYLKNDGTLALIAVTISSGQPSTPSGDIVIWLATTGSSTVTSHTDLRNTTPFTFSQISGFMLAIGQGVSSSTSGYALYVDGSNKLANATIPTILGFTPENVANKATSFGTLNSTLYPTTQAASTEIASQVAAGIATRQKIAQTVTTTSSPLYIVLSTDYYIDVDATSIAVTVQLPLPSSCPGQSFYIAVGTGDVTTHNLTITVTGGSLFKGSASYVVNTANKGVTAISNGTIFTGIIG